MMGTADVWAYETWVKWMADMGHRSLEVERSEPFVRWVPQMPLVMRLLLAVSTGYRPENRRSRQRLKRASFVSDTQVCRHAPAP